MNFSLSDEEFNKFVEWEATLPPEPTSVSGGRFKFSFIPTSIGCIAKVYDCVSDTEIDVTDYQSW